MPSVSKYQWHPFTITSYPFNPYISVHMRLIGDFTRSLRDTVGAGPAQSKFYEEASVDPVSIYEVALQNGQQMPTLKIDGPYGAPAEDVFEDEIVILIGAGIGVTPWASILKIIWHMRNRNKELDRLRRVEFIRMSRDVSSFEWFQSLLSSLEDRPDEVQGALTNQFLRIHTFLTQKLDANTAQKVILNTVGADTDPLTQLKARTNFGRPDFWRILTVIRDGIVDGTYLSGLERNLRTQVGVYFCGHLVAAREIKSTCRQVSDPDVEFKFWKEHF